LRFGKQAQQVFKVDEEVVEQKRQTLRLHYAQMQSRKSLNFQSEEDIRRQNHTLTKLY